MPRKSAFDKLFDDTIQKLTNVRNKLDPRTYRAYERKIIGTNRKDTLNKINTELNEFRNYVIDGNKTLPVETKDPLILTVFVFLSNVKVPLPLVAPASLN